jgi:IclR family transcriptional regulator, pca regulon regulatory protein
LLFCVKRKTLLMPALPAADKPYATTHSSVASSPSVAPARADMIDGLRKGLEVICAFDDGTPRLTQSELAARLDLSRAAARRYLMTLTALGYMATDGKAYWLTPKVMRLGHSYVASSRLPRTVLPTLQALTEALGESTNVCVLEGDEAVYISRVNAPKLLSTGIEPGTRLPAYTSAGGRLILSLSPDDKLDAWLDAVTLKRHTPFTLVDKVALKRELLKTRKQGYCIAESQLEIGLRGLSVPLIDGPGHVVGAISVSMSIAALSASVAIKRFVPAMREAALRLRDRL